MQGSMGHVGSAGDNAPMELFFSLLQTNMVLTMGGDRLGLGRFVAVFRRGPGPSLHDIWSLGARRGGVLSGWFCPAMLPALHRT